MSDVSTTLRINDEASSVLKKVGQSATNAAKKMEQLGRTMDNAFKTNTPTQLSSKVGNTFSSMESKASSLGNKIDQAFESQKAETFGSKAQSGFRNAETGADKFKESASQAGEKVEELGKKTSEVGEKTKEIGQGANGVKQIGDEAQKSSEQLGQASNQATSLASSIKKVAAVIGGLAIANKVKQFVTDSINLGRDYTAQMSEVAAISGATGDDYKMLQETAREYGATTIFSATEAAEALKYMSLAGWDAQQSSSALGGVLNLAAASGMDLGQASDMVTDYLSAFGMQAKQSAYFADMLSYAQSNSNTTAAQLGDAYLNSAAIMHSAGQDVETTTAMLEAMANQGTKGARAGTQMAAIMRDITQKMDKGKIKIGETSIAVQDAKGNFRDLTDIMTDVEKATEGMGSAARSAALSETFTSDSTKGVNQILTEGMSKISQYEEELRNSGGAAEKAADIMNDNLKGDQANLNSAFEELQLQVFEGLNGTLRSGTQYLTNSIIPILTSWVPKAAQKAAQGISKIADVLKPVFEGVLKNPGAITGVFGSMATGILAFKGINRFSGMVSGFKTLGTAISTFKSAGRTAETVKALTDSTSGLTGVAGGIGKIATTLAAHPIAAGAAAAAAGITAIAIAVKKYNEAKVKQSFAEKFGDVELNEDQAKAFANKILNLDWRSNMESALEHVTQGQDLAKQASEALSSNDVIEWKARLGFKLDESDISNYQTNIQSFIDDVEQSISQQTLALKLSVSEMDITLSDGTDMSDLAEKWATEDTAKANSLSQQLSKTVEEALKDGIISVDEQEAIDLLQQKINKILNSWNQGQAQAEMDILQQKYGQLSGEDLTEGSFTEVISQLSEQRKSAIEAAEEQAKNDLAVYESKYNTVDEKGNRAMTYDQLQSAKAETYKWLSDQNAQALANSVNFETNTVANAYKDSLEKSSSGIKDSISNFLPHANDFLENNDYTALFDTFQNGFAQAQSAAKNQDRGAMKELWKQMLPDVQDMTDVIDQYAQAGETVPAEVMSSFNKAMEVGAAAGDADATWAVMARQLVSDPANKALVQAIEDGTVSVPAELEEALTRATAGIQPTLSIDTLQAAIKRVEVNGGNIGDLLQQQIDGLSAGQQIETDAGTVAVKYDVETEMTASDLASKLGMQVNDLLAQNPGLTSNTPLKVGTAITIDENGVTVDTSGVGQAVMTATQQAADSAGPQTAKVDMTLGLGSIDSSGLTSGFDQVFNTSPETFANRKVSGTVDAEFTKGSDNLAQVYAQGQQEAAAKWQTPYNVDGSVNVALTAHYKVKNSPAHISTSSSGGTVSVSVSANGRYVNSPMLSLIGEDGPEYVIPVGAKRRDRGLDLWAQAGQSLGVPGFADGGFIGASMPQVSGTDGFMSQVPDNSPQALPYAGFSDSPTVTPTQVLGTDSNSTAQISDNISKDINLNINGNGSIKINSNMSKEEVVDILSDNVKDVLMNIVQQEIMDEGDGAYEY